MSQVKAITDVFSDERLMERIATSDQTALRALFERHHHRVFKFILRLTRNESAAEDLVNEVFMEVWRNAGNFGGRSSVPTWILSIAHHRTVSSLRKRREESWDEETAGTLADDRDDPEVSVQKQNKSEVMRRCMEQLSAEHREVIDLVYYHEMSITEVAGVVGIPENTVKTRVFHARKKLSALLQAAGVDRGWP
jgi:RNA polymerase sigma-70 factor (ECF subfamily)